ncbi:MAG: 6-phosphofructokinase [Defluviitaleaceae bacterium]|nr:6-phosphofructokinase [Defluviitaleaceae bacterium]
MGKNAIVGQSGGPTAVINSSLAGVVKNAFDRKIPKVYGMRYGVKSLVELNVIDMADYIMEEIDFELLKRTPSSFLGSCRFKLPLPDENEEIYKIIFNNLKKLNIGYFFYIGGNDSMDTVMKLSKYGQMVNSDIRFMGVPKTIDNDLEISDHCPGYGSAAKYIAATTKELILDADVYDTKAACIVEVMGRNAGWLAGAAALSRGVDCDGPDGIFLPEAKFDIDIFVTKIAERLKTGSVLMVVAEGIKLEDGRYISELGSDLNIVDAFGHRMLTGASRYLAETVNHRLGVKTRSIEFGTMQRAAAHIISRVDMTEAFQVGSAAVTAAWEGQTNKVIVLKRVSNDPYICVTDIVDVTKVANVEKKVPLDWITPSGDDVTHEFIKYATPLIQAELTPFMVNGMPRHITIASKDKQRGRN